MFYLVYFFCIQDKFVAYDWKAKNSNFWLTPTINQWKIQNTILKLLEKLVENYNGNSLFYWKKCNALKLWFSFFEHTIRKFFTIFQGRNVSSFEVTRKETEVFVNSI